MKKTAVILLNVGSPDYPDKKHVRKFLVNFLNDRKVIDLPWLLQKLLVNLIIVPFRASRSSEKYKRLWSSNGSPLIFYSQQATEKLQKILPDNYTVFNSMRYGNPGYKEALKNIKFNRYDKIIIFPLFPQYADSTTGTAIHAILKEIEKWNFIPELRIISQFYQHEGFINAIVHRAKECKYEDYEHVIFSFHGLPLRHINKIHTTVNTENCSCTKEMPEHGSFCYKATCYETSRLLALKLNLSDKQYSVTFQSRLSKNWLKPFTDETILNLAQKGIKKILVFAPSFVVDCLETTDEIGFENGNLFLKHGGKELKLVPGLNDLNEWIETMKDIILK